jgi:hypothetical protein
MSGALNRVHARAGKRPQHWKFLGAGANRVLQRNRHQAGLSEVLDAESCRCVSAGRHFF